MEEAKFLCNNITCLVNALELKTHHIRFFEVGIRNKKSGLFDICQKMQEPVDSWLVSFKCFSLF